MGTTEETAAAIDELIAVYEGVLGTLAEARSSIIAASDELRGRLGNTSHPKILQAMAATKHAAQRLAEADTVFRAAIRVLREWSGLLGVPSTRADSTAPDERCQPLIGMVAVAGPAATIPLRRPNTRHELNGMGRKCPAKSQNTIVMPGVDLDADLLVIQEGRATWNQTTQRYELPNGRVYGVKANGTLFPEFGPGFRDLTRGEYQALQQFIAASGDLERAREAMARNPFITEVDKRCARDVFRHHRDYRG